MDNYATITQLENFWRPLEQSETTRAEALLEAATNKLRLIARNNGVDLDEKICDDDTLSENVSIVVVEAVKRAMLRPTDAPPADQWSQSASPYSESMRFTNPTSDLFFKKTELALLGLGSISGRGQIGIVRGIR